MKSLIHNVGILMFLGGLPAVFVAGFGCRDADEPCLTCPPPYVQTIFLDTVYTEPTEIGVRVTMADSLATSTVQIFRDTTEIFSKRVLANDTTIVDDSLLPARTYRYTAYRLTNGPRVDSSNILTARTMDTTSHEFRWEIDTLGDGNSSVLYDVAIVNDTLVYAVGEIYHSDSSENWTFFNFAKWNGRDWTLHRLYYQGYIQHLRWILAFNESDIWVNPILHWDGVQWQQLPFDPIFSGVTTTKAWGTSSSDFYVVGYNGFIAHYSSGAWRRLESGTDVSLLDVWGSPDGSTVWACGWEDFKPTVLLRLRNGVWEKAWEDQAYLFTQRDDSLSGAFTSVWLPNNRQLYALSWYGVYRCPVTTHGEAKRIAFPPTWSGFLWRIRGNALNDWVIVGEYYMIAHFNGFTFKHYPELSGYGRLRSVAQKESLIIAVGETFDPIDGKGIVYRGRR